MTRSQPHPARRRGTAYVAVLGTTMLVTLMGVSALTVVRLERLAANATGDAERASLLAQSAVELALRETQSDGWRTRHTSGAWSAPMTLEGGTMRYRFTDPLDGNLAAGTHAAHVEGEGLRGGAKRLVSVMIDPTTRRSAASTTASLVPAGGFESDIAGWVGSASGGNLSPSAVSPRTGAWCLMISSPGIAARYDLTGNLTSPGSYDVELYARARDVGERIAARLEVTSSGDGTRTFSIEGFADRTWTRLAGTLNPTWSGALERVELVLEFDPLFPQDGFIDDVRLLPRAAEPAPVVPGSWRQVVVP